MPRVSLRRVGEASGCIAKLPESFGELLATADTKLLKQPGSNLAKRVFAASGDEILEDDFELIEHDDVLYVSCGEEWAALPLSCSLHFSRICANFPTLLSLRPCLCVRVVFSFVSVVVVESWPCASAGSCKSHASILRYYLTWHEIASQPKEHRTKLGSV